MSSKILPLKVVFSTTEISEVAEASGVLGLAVAHPEGVGVAEALCTGVGAVVSA